MSESSNSAWPFGEISDEEGLDIAAIFKDSAGTVDQGNPFASPVEAAVPAPAPEAQEPTAESAEPAPALEPAAAPAPIPKEPETPVASASKPTAATPAEKPAPAQPEVNTDAENPIAAAFEKKTAENTKKGLLEKPPVFYHKGVKDEIEDPSMTFEELQGMFEAKQIDFDTVEERDYLNEGTGAGRGFAVSGGVAKAVTDLVHEQYPDMEIQTARAEGLRECRKLMMLAKAGKFKGCLLEGMACPGGCVAGAGTMQSIKKSAAVVGVYAKQAEHQTATGTHHVAELDKLVD